ncbi:MAG: hypothetical protein Q8K77_08395 [Thermodesulfovibrionales bacterium]|nr:hypothetical protein [Thermodesulfovibrionales bacterium]
MTVLIFFSVIAFTLLFFAIYIGITIRLSMILFGLLSFPVYMGLYAIECFFAKDVNSILSFNLPKTNPRRYFMDILASIVTACYLIFGINVYFRGSTKTFMQNFLNGDFFPFPWNLLPYLVLTIMYVISYKTQRDTSEILDKIKSLSMPSILGKFSEKIIDK